MRLNSGIGKETVGKRLSQRFATEGMNGVDFVHEYAVVRGHSMQVIGQKASSRVDPMLVGVP